MQTLSLSPASLGSFTYPGRMLAAFSPCRFVVKINSAAVVSIVLSNTTTGRSVTEKHTARMTGASGYEAVFDIARLLQGLGDVDSLLQRISYDPSLDSYRQLSDVVGITILVGSRQAYAGNFVVAYATADWQEKRGAADSPHALRAYRDLPYTIPTGYNDDEAYVGYTYGDLFVATGDAAEAAPLTEVPLWGVSGDVDALGDGDSATIVTYPNFSIPDGDSGSGLDVTSACRRVLNLSVHSGTHGVYLRWLRRDGSCGYWRFTRSKTAVSVSAGNSFSRYLSGFPQAPENGVYGNASRCDMATAETLTIGCCDVTESEWRELLDLASSPLVEMLVGGTQTAPLWVRVNVVPGSYSRQHNRSGLGTMADFEMQIELPQRNTVQL